MMFSKPRSVFWQDTLSFIKNDQSTFYITKTTQIMKQSGPQLIEYIMESHKQNVVIIPVEILDNRSTCDIQKNYTNFGYVINEHANSWVSLDGVIMKKFICASSGISTTPYYIFVLIIFLLILVIIGMIYNMIRTDDTIQSMTGLD